MLMLFLVLPFYFISTSVPIDCPGRPFSKIARRTPLFPWAEEILPVIVLGSFPGDFQLTLFPTSFVAFSLVSTPSTSSKKCFGVNVFRPLRNWMTVALTIIKCLEFGL